MEKVWFLVFFFIIFNKVLANRDCSNLENLKSCDECIRCSGTWCNDPNEKVHCYKDPMDNDCKDHLERVPTVPVVLRDGGFFKPAFRLTTVRSGRPDSYNIQFPYNNDQPNITTLTSSTQSYNFENNNELTCAGGVCELNVDTTPATGFCQRGGGAHEYINITLQLGREEALLRYHVPCACKCSEQVVHRSPICSGRGNFSCGVCTCDMEWTGTFCEKPICEGTRGDICEDPSSERTCFGNGVCNECGKCQCFVDKEGSRYFDSDGGCADLCQVTNNFDLCLDSPEPGKCMEHPEANLFNVMYNQSLLAESDELGHVWVKCNITFNNCPKKYAAMKKDGNTFYMIISSCDPVVEQRVGAINLTLPIVLGLIALAATTAATAAYLVWKNRTPPLPMTDPMYQNIDAEDCTGENPLYKPPTSIFNNPTYGKWQ